MIAMARSPWQAAGRSLLVAGLLLGTVSCTAATSIDPGSPASSAPATPTGRPVVSAPMSVSGTMAPSALRRGPLHPERTDVIEGSWLVGSDIPPALYTVPVPTTHCMWRVLDSASGAVIDEGEYAGSGPAAVWLQDGDLFRTQGCLLWQGFSQLTGSRGSPSPPPGRAPDAPVIGDGIAVVGRDARAGRYRSDRAATGRCEYRVTRRESGRRVTVERFSSTTLARAIPHYLDLMLAPGDEFSTYGCGRWLRIDP